MKFKLSAYTIYEQGPRPRQEDSIFPAHNGTQEGDRLFLVCDGMGGHSAGDVASSTVCSALSSHISANVADVEGDFSDDNFKEALTAAYDALDAKDDGSPKKMGTTLTLLKLHKGGYTIAHIGDSRVYHIRPGADAETTEILFQTQDHSLVNDLVRIGELTPEEAKTSKQRNVITRAIQPNQERRSRADIAHGNDIKPGDYFMLCSDGILEQMEDDNLKFIFSELGGDTERKIDILIKVTEGNHDNHSAVIVRIDDVELAADDVIVPYEKPMAVESEVFEPHGEDAPLPENDVEEEEQEPKGGILAQIKSYVVPTLIVLAIVAAGFFIYDAISSSKDDKKVEGEQTEATAEEVATTDEESSTSPGDAGGEGDNTESEGDNPEGEGNDNNLTDDPDNENSGDKEPDATTTDKPTDKPTDEPIDEPTDEPAADESQVKADETSGETQRPDDANA